MHFPSGLVLAFACISCFTAVSHAYMDFLSFLGCLLILIWFLKIRHIQQGQELALQIEQSAHTESGVKETSKGFNLQTKVSCPYLNTCVVLLLFYIVWHITFLGGFYCVQFTFYCRISEIRRDDSWRSEVDITVSILSNDIHEYIHMFCCLITLVYQEEILALTEGSSESRCPLNSLNCGHAKWFTLPIFWLVRYCLTWSVSLCRKPESKKTPLLLTGSADDSYKKSPVQTSILSLSLSSPLPVLLIFSEYTIACACV
jgi:hypothetical protein